MKSILAAATFCLLCGLTVAWGNIGDLTPAPEDRCPITGRFPVEITLETEQELTFLGDWDIDIASVHGRVVTAWVDDATLAGLEVAGYAVRPVPNQGRRAFLEMLRSGREDYHTYATLTAELQQIAADHPNIAMLTSIGRSVEGRDLWFLKISDNVQEDEPEPEFKFSSSLHGDEVVGMELCVYLIRRLVDDYGTDPAITALVDGLEIWIMPLSNPDGNAHGTRYNAQGYDLNRCFPDPVTDPNDDPAGRPEEVQHMMNFVYDHNFLLSANYHTGALVMNYPWDSMSGQYTPDNTMIRNLASGYAQRNPPMYNNPEFPGGIIIGWQWYVIHGGMQDWSYYWRNDIDITIECCNTFWPPSSWLPGLWNDNEEAMLWYMGRTRIGVEGQVTDATDGYPVKATYDVTQIGKPMWGEPVYGYYHRMLEPGTYTLQFNAFGYSQYQANNVVVTSGGPANRDVAMTPTQRYTVSGVVRENLTGQPLAGQVAAYRHDNGEIFRVVATDPATGAYTIGVPASTYDFIASSEGHAPLTVTRQITGATTIDFALLRGRGNVLVVRDGNHNPRVSADLAAAGYLVTEEMAGMSNPATWPDYDLLVWSAGTYGSPIAAQADRTALEAFVGAGGKLLIEGGEIGYDATRTPGYPSFAANVLHVSGWHEDQAGQLELRSGQSGHPLVTTPNPLPGTIQITYDAYGDQDAVIPLADATLIYGTHDRPTDAGILVHDVQVGVEGQIVYFAFDYAALTNDAVARALIQNTTQYLIGNNQGIDEPTVAAAISLSQVHPSLTTGPAVVELRLSEAADVAVDVFDASGRRVREISRGTLEIGSHILRWDGRDEAGLAAPAGVYFLRAATPAGEASRRIVVVE